MAASRWSKRTISCDPVAGGLWRFGRHKMASVLLVRRLWPTLPADAIPPKTTDPCREIERSKMVSPWEEPLFRLFSVTSAILLVFVFLRKGSFCIAFCVAVYCDCITTHTIYRIEDQSPVGPVQALPIPSGMSEALEYHRIAETEGDRWQVSKATFVPQSASLQLARYPRANPQQLRPIPPDCPASLKTYCNCTACYIGYYGLTTGNKSY